MTIEQIYIAIQEGKERLCKNCNTILPVSEFFIKKDPQNKHCRFNSPCKKCANKKRNIHYQRNYQMKKNFNIGIDAYKQFLVQQNNRCAICDKHFDTFSKNLAIDHDHRTNHIRGLLCQSCNLGLGYFYDNPTILFSAIRYLKRNFQYIT